MEINDVVKSYVLALRSEQKLSLMMIAAWRARHKGLLAVDCQEITS